MPGEAGSRRRLEEAVIATGDNVRKCFAAVENVTGASTPGSSAEEPGPVVVEAEEAVVAEAVGYEDHLSNS